MYQIKLLGIQDGTPFEDWGPVQDLCPWNIPPMLPSAPLLRSTMNKNVVLKNPEMILGQAHK